MCLYIIAFCRNSIFCSVFQFIFLPVLLIVVVYMKSCKTWDAKRKNYTLNCNDLNFSVSHGYKLRLDMSCEKKVELVIKIVCFNILANILTWSHAWSFVYIFVYIS